MIIWHQQIYSDDYNCCVARSWRSQPWFLFLWWLLWQWWHRKGWRQSRFKPNAFADLPWLLSVLIDKICLQETQKCAANRLLLWSYWSTTPLFWPIRDAASFLIRAFLQAVFFIYCHTYFSDCETWISPILQISHWSMMPIFWPIRDAAAFLMRTFFKCLFKFSANTLILIYSSLSFIDLKSPLYCSLYCSALLHSSL